MSAEGMAVHRVTLPSRILQRHILVSFNQTLAIDLNGSAWWEEKRWWCQRTFPGFFLEWLLVICTHSQCHFAILTLLCKTSHSGLQQLYLEQQPCTCSDGVKVSCVNILSHSHKTTCSRFMCRSYVREFNHHRLKYSENCICIEQAQTCVSCQYSLNNSAKLFTQHWYPAMYFVSNLNVIQSTQEDVCQLPANITPFYIWNEHLWGLNPIPYDHYLLCKTAGQHLTHHCGLDCNGRLGSSPFVHIFIHAELAQFLSSLPQLLCHYGRYKYKNIWWVFIGRSSYSTNFCVKNT